MKYYRIACLMEEGSDRREALSTSAFASAFLLAHTYALTLQDHEYVRKSERVRKSIALVPAL
jgi:hypothetical protein